MTGNSTLVRLNKDAYSLLHGLSAAEGLSMQEILSRALERYRRERFFEESRAAIARLQANSAAWEDYQQEIALLDGASGDGLQENEYPEFANETSRGRGLVNTVS
jgi:hypothetical protein